MSNRIAAAHAALFTALKAAFEARGGKVFRNPEGMRHFDQGEMVLSMQDDESAETLRVMSGPVYDLKAEPLITLARKVAEPDRRDGVWGDVDLVRATLEADPTLGGEVEDARIAQGGVEPAEMDRNKWMAGGLDVTIRLLFAAPSAAG